MFPEHNKIPTRYILSIDYTTAKGDLTIVPIGSTHHRRVKTTLRYFLRDINMNGTTYSGNISSFNTIATATNQSVANHFNSHMLTTKIADVLVEELRINILMKILLLKTAG